MDGLDRPWVVIDGVIPDPDRIIKEYGEELRDLRENGASEGETRIVHGRIFADAAVAEQVAGALRKASELTKITYKETEPIRLLRYSAGGLYSWHADNELIDEEHRKLSVVIALNDGYEGGSTEFMWPRPGESEVVRLKPGSALIFPSFMYHRALEVTSGLRWILFTCTVGESYR